MAGFLGWAADAMKSVGNFLLPGEPFKKIQPISIVSTKPVEIGTTDTKTRSIYEVITPLGIKSVFRKDTAVSSTADITGIGKAIIAPPDYYLTAQNKSSGSQSNIFDIINNTAKSFISTGFNVLTQKLEDFGKSPETVYVPSAPASQTSGTKSSFSDTILSKILNPIIQPAVKSGIEAGIKGGISDTVSKPPAWIWIALIGFGAILLIRRR